MLYQQVIARRYAKGLMLSAKDVDLEAVEAELHTFVEAFSDRDSGLLRLFDDPAFSPLERKAVLDRLKEVLKMSDSLYNFLLLLVDKGRIDLLPLIHGALVGLIDDRKNRVRAHITSATPVDAKFVHDITHALKEICKKDVLMKSTVMPEVLGGVRVEVGDLIFDGTVKAKLEALKSKLSYEV